MFNEKLFNEKQRDGFARVFDTLAASAIIGFILGIFGRAQSELALRDCVLLIGVAGLCLISSCFLRE